MAKACQVQEAQFMKDSNLKVIFLAVSASHKNVVRLDRF